MKEGFATMMALALVVGAVGLSVVPTAVAVGPDCDDEFAIPDSEPASSRTLLSLGEETGMEPVSASGGDEEVTVRLDSPDDELEFGVFYFDGTNCVKAQDDNLSDCGASVDLDTAGGGTDQAVCEIKAPQSDTRTYYFHVENQELDSLEYSIWVSG